jgi:hypothetical protein
MKTIFGSICLFIGAVASICTVMAFAQEQKTLGIRASVFAAIFLGVGITCLR